MSFRLSFMNIYFFFTVPFLNTSAFCLLLACLFLCIKQKPGITYKILNKLYGTVSFLHGTAILCSCSIENALKMQSKAFIIGNANSGPNLATTIHSYILLDHVYPPVYFLCRRNYGSNQSYPSVCLCY